MLEPDGPCRQRLLKRGGARNRGDRRSDRLNETQCQSLIRATQHTLNSGKGFNRFLTISWELGGVAPKRSVDATVRFIALARDWLRDRGEPIYWAWVQEWGIKFGAHCHILLHVPEYLANHFRVMPLRWVKTVIEPGAHRGGILDTQRWRSNANPLHVPQALDAKLMGKVHYMLKAAPPELEARLGMSGRGHRLWGQYCPVYGKRLAVSQSCRG